MKVELNQSLCYLLYFLAFANNPSDRLAQLIAEDEVIHGHLLPWSNKQRIQLHRNSFTKLDVMAKELASFHPRVALLHYAGHAESQHLLLEDGAADAQGIASLLGRQEALQLVFLNGCATEAQTIGLLRAGVKSVIATSVPINDFRAKKFADHFYHALCLSENPHTLGGAFEQAKSLMQGEAGVIAMGEQSQQIGDLSIASRGLKLPKRAETSIDMPWALYYRAEDREAVLNWKLPTETAGERPIVIRSATDRYQGQQVIVNEQLVNQLFEALAEYSDELEFLQFQANKGKKVDIRMLRRAIMDCLPAPIGEQIRKLFAADSKGGSSRLDEVSEARLAQLVSTYGILMELLSFIVMAQLWDVKFEQKEEWKSLAMSEAAIADFFDPQKPGIVGRRMPFFLHLHSLLQAQNADFFITELLDFGTALTAEPLAEAVAFMDALEAQLAMPDVKIGADELPQFCLAAEDHLGKTLSAAAFLAKYKLLTVKNIDFVKTRHAPPQYRHYKVNLDTVTAGYLDVDEVYEKYTDNKSVILLKSEDRISPSLNLSPFILDENAFTGNDKSKLFFFQAYHATKQAYRFKFAYVQTEELWASKASFPEIHAQFEAFRECMERGEVQGSNVQRSNV